VINFLSIIFCVLSLHCKHVAKFVCDDVHKIITIDSRYEQEAELDRERYNKEKKDYQLTKKVTIFCQKYFFYKFPLNTNPTRSSICEIICY
jgi:hypothetical protein